MGNPSQLECNRCDIRINHQQLNTESKEKTKDVAALEEKKKTLQLHFTETEKLVSKSIEELKNHLQEIEHVRNELIQKHKDMSECISKRLETLKLQDDATSDMDLETKSAICQPHPDDKVVTEDESRHHDIIQKKFQVALPRFQPILVQGGCLSFVKEEELLKSPSDKASISSTRASCETTSSSVVSLKDIATALTKSGDSKSQFDGSHNTSIESNHSDMTYKPIRPKPVYISNNSNNLSHKDLRTEKTTSGSVKIEQTSSNCSSKKHQSSLKSETMPNPVSNKCFGKKIEPDETISKYVNNLTHQLSWTAKAKSSNISSNETDKKKSSAKTAMNHIKTVQDRLSFKAKKSSSQVTNNSDKKTMTSKSVKRYNNNCHWPIIHRHTPVLVD